jgi:glutathione synthase
MRLGFILDPLNQLKPRKDSSIAMMRSAARRGDSVHAAMRDTLAWHDDQVFADWVKLDLVDGPDWYREGEHTYQPLRDFDAILMRQDPPFDFEYLTATWLLERATIPGALIFNHPRALRDHSEKLALTEFSHFAPPTLVARDPVRIGAWIDEQADVVMKPLDGMGGSSVFRVRADDPNRNVIVETLTAMGRRTAMVQRYIPEISAGDKRILILGGQVVPYALARIPKAGELRGNLAAGGTGIVQALSDRDREIATALAPILWARGLLVVGLDVIGDFLTEINVTSPTGFVEITQQTGFDVAAMCIDAVYAAVQARSI